LNLSVWFRASISKI